MARACSPDGTATGGRVSRNEKGTNSDQAVEFADRMEPRAGHAI
jgi:hypothetical protein